MEFRKEKILVVDDEKPIREVLCASLADEGFIVDSAIHVDMALDKIDNFKPQVVLLDVWMPGRDGLELLKELSHKTQNPDIIVMSGHGNIETAVEATKLGAWDFIEKPISMEKVIILLKNILSLRKIRGERKSLLNKLRQNIAIIGNSLQAKEIKELVAKVAPTNSVILIQGEPGVGKELVAKNIHYLSPRAGQNFVDFKCASVTQELILGELFGYEKHSVIGSSHERRGFFDKAEKGTLFIDDVDQLPHSVQMVLLKFLDEGRIQRVGGDQKIELDVRIIASTSQNLGNLVEKGLFRRDLYYRLRGVSFFIPPLHERRADIEPLIHHFSQKACLSGGYTEKKFSPQSIKELLAYDWPGNIREIKNFIERIYILTSEDSVDVHDLTFSGLHPRRGESFSETSNFKKARSEFEKRYILKKISEHRGNISRTAESIGLERSYLHRKIKGFGIDI